LIDLFLLVVVVVMVNKLNCDKKDKSNMSSYPECLASELSILAKSRDGNIQMHLMKFYSISVGDNQEVADDG
jgi:hypothetical protein